MKLLFENWRKYLNEDSETILKEVALAPAIYNALKAKGKLPPGATIKQAAPAAQAQQAAPAAQAQQAAPAQGKLLDVDRATRFDKEEAQAAGSLRVYIKMSKNPKYANNPKQMSWIQNKILKARKRLKAASAQAAQAQQAAPAKAAPQAQQAAPAQSDKMAQLAALDKDVDGLSDEEALARVKAMKKK